MNLSRLELTAESGSEGDQLLLTVENTRSGERRSGVFGQLQPGSIRVTLFELSHGGVIPGSLQNDRLCYRATPLTESGTLGQELELGCIRPTDEDPRTDDLRGCAAGPHGLEHAQNLGLWLVALVLVRVRLARRVRRADDIPIS